MMKNRVTEDQYQVFYNGLLISDRILCTQVLQDVLHSDVDIKDVYVYLFQRALYEVGEQWERGRISVAVEHAATAIIERLLTVVQSKVLSGGERTYTAIIACVADEYHQLGARIVADMFELHGWRCYFLGANTPLPDLLQMIHKHQPEVLGLSLSIYFNLPSLLHAHTVVRKEFPNQAVIVGGQGFRWGGSEALSTDPHVMCISSLDDLERYLKTYGTN
jgi:methanogenic corrinoid protein MtbC1